MLCAHIPIATLISLVTSSISLAYRIYKCILVRKCILARASVQLQICIHYAIILLTIMLEYFHGPESLSPLPYSSSLPANVACCKTLPGAHAHSAHVKLS